MHRHEPAENFWRRVKVGKKNECWPFLQYRNKKGYGEFRFKGKVSLSHRIAYMIARKDPKGLCVLHRCDNPPCCNPKHLFLGTRRDNVDDRHEKGRDNAPRGEEHHDAKLATSDVICIRASKAKGISLAKKYGVSPAAISSIRRRRSWRHI